jgi:hypothetical protein
MPPSASMTNSGPCALRRETSSSSSRRTRCGSTIYMISENAVSRHALLKRRPAARKGYLRAYVPTREHAYTRIGVKAIKGTYAPTRIRA